MDPRKLENFVQIMGRKQYSMELDLELEKKMGFKNGLHPPHTNETKSRRGIETTTVVTRYEDTGMTVF